MRILMQAIQQGCNSGGVRDVSYGQNLLFFESFSFRMVYRDPVVVPPDLREEVLKALHAAHQGISTMERRVMTHDIKMKGDSCVYCNGNALSQAATPLRFSKPSSIPFEKIFAN